MTSDQIKELRRLAEVATPGPWVHRNNDGSIGSVDAVSGPMVAQTQAMRTPGEQCNKERNANAAFIAAANPTAILSLIARIEALEQDAKHLHVKLAGETLRADQGWERYEAANKSRNALEAAMVAQQDKGKETV